MKYFQIIIDKNHDRSVGIGLDIYFHRHVNRYPIHFHICFTLLFWFLEIHIGKEVPEGEE